MALDDAGILAALHEGMFQKPLWTDFLEILRAQTGARYAVMIFRTADQNAVTELYGKHWPPTHFHRRFVTEFAGDPFAYRHMRPERVYSLDDLLDPSDPVHRAFQRDLMEPQGLSNMRSVRVTEPERFDAWLGCAGDGAVGAGAGALLKALVPHLKIALRTFAAFEREQFRAAVTADAFGKLNFGWMTLDARARIIDTTPHVEHLFERSAILRRGPYDRLIPSAAGVDRALGDLLKRFAEQPDSRPQAISLSRDPWVDMLVAPIKRRPLTGALRPVAIVYLSGDRSSMADRCGQLADLFGLLPSEARLAWALAGGLSIREAADELGLTVETARNYSKKIYAKTGSKGQSELVRNILTSVLAIA